MKKPVSFWLVGAALAGASCGDSLTGPSALTGPTWRLRSLQVSGSQQVTIQEPDRFTAEFGGDGQVGVRADCNVCGSAYSVEGRSLRVEGLICTKVACASAPVDTQFVQLLEGPSTLDADDDELTLRSDRGTLRFER